MKSILDADLAATISPTEQYSDLSDKELDCPFNVRCQMHGQARGGRERVRFIQSWTLAKICNVGSASVKSEASQVFWRYKAVVGNDWKMSRDLMSSRPNGGGHREPSQPTSFIAYVV